MTASTPASSRPASSVGRSTPAGLPARPPTAQAAGPPQPELTAPLPAPHGDHEPAGAARRRRLAVLAASGIALLVAVVVGVVVAGVITASSGSSVSQPNPPAPAPLVPAPTATAEAVAAEVAELKRFVEAQRGLQFRSEVPATVLDDQAFTDRLLAELEPDLPLLAQRARVLATLGLVGPGENVVDATVGLIVTSALGFYDPASGEVVVRGEQLDPLVRRTLVHELVHALDDQWFDLDRPNGGWFADDTLGISAVSEGNAMRIDQRWVDTLDPDSRRDLLRREVAASGQTDLNAVPWAVVELLSASYLYGPALVGTVEAIGGEQAIDVALTEPPPSSAAVLWPELYVADVRPTDVPPPPVEGTPLDQGVLGELTLRLALSTAVRSDVAIAAARAWRGDTYVAWSNDQGADCITVDTETDNAEQADRLREAISELAAVLPDASWQRVGDDTVRLTSCVQPDEVPAGSESLL